MRYLSSPIIALSDVTFNVWRGGGKASFRGEGVGKKVLEAQPMRAGGWEDKGLLKTGGKN